jgi:hypothetical protein
MQNFNMGERVWFDREGEVIKGRIIKFNQKTISILTEDNIQWNVTPSLLRRQRL